MARCNLDLMVQFSCEQLREKRARAIISIAEDERLLRRLDAQIRNAEISIADRRARITRLRGDVPTPGLPGPVQQDDNRRPKRPGPVGIIVDTAEAVLRQTQNGREIRRLEGEIERFEVRVRESRADRQDRIARLNEARDGRRCIQEAMWRKRCSGA